MRPATAWLLAMVASAAATAQQPVAGAEPSPPKTLADAFARAREKMKADRAPGLVFVLPAADAPFDEKEAARLEELFASRTMGNEKVLELTNARDILLAQLQLLRGSQSPAAVALRALAVQLVAEPDVVGSKPGETIVLLSADGKRVFGAKVDLGDEGAVIEALTPVVLAKKAVEPRRRSVEPALGKLAARHRELQKQADERRQKGESLDPEQFEEWNGIRERLFARLTAAAPAFVEFDDGRAVVRSGDGMHWQMMADDAVPFGTATGKQWDPCPPCGMMAGPLALRSTLKLLAK